MASMMPVYLDGIAQLRHVLAPSTIYIGKTLVERATVRTGGAATPFVTSVVGVATRLAT